VPEDPKSRERGQLSLFGASPPTARAHRGPRVEPLVDDETRAIAARVPAHVYMGTSSWTFPGWRGVVWAGAPSQADLVATGLAAYATHPLFRVAGVDRSYYGPLTSDDLAGYAAQLPPRYPCISKVWEEITTFAFPDHPRLGDRAGALNPSFLDPARTRDEVLAAYDAFDDHAGPFVFEIPPIPRNALPRPDSLARAIERLLAALPERYAYAFELRNRELFTRRYLDTLRAHGAAHVLSFWTGMPTVGEQLDLPGVLTAPFVVARLMLPPGSRYEERRAELAPFDRIVSPQREMRRDIVHLARACAAAGKTLFILVNNKAEGSAPLTIRALAEALGRDAMAAGNPQEGGKAGRT
jgi:uncharacterized protein YecE (DUF72 family)